MRDPRIGEASVRAITYRGKSRSLFNTYLRANLKFDPKYNKIYIYRFKFYTKIHTNIYVKMSIDFNI